MGSETVLLTILLFAGLLIGILVGIPVFVVMLGVSLIVGVIGVGPAFFPMMLLRTFHTMQNYILAAIPLFVFMGVMLECSGAAERLFSSTHVILGGLRGSLAITTVVICTIMAAATGIMGAPVITMGLFALPAMLKRNYDKALSCGSVCAGGTLGILIPPSIMLVVYGPMAGISVGKLFMGAIFPGLVLSGLFITYIIIRCTLRPELGPALSPEERAIPATRKIWMFVTSLLPTLLLILAVLGTIFFGIAAPTEAAAIGAFAGIMLAAAYRNLTWQALKEATYRTLTVSSMIMMTVVGAFVFTGTFTLIGGMDLVESALMGLAIGRWGILAIMAFCFLILGFFMEWVGIVPILVPMFAPIIAEFGFDPLWCAVLFCVVMQTAFLTPPMAPALFYIKGVAPRDIEFGPHIVRGVIPFIGLQLLGVALVATFPELVTWLPSLMIK